MPQKCSNKRYPVEPRQRYIKRNFDGSKIKTGNSAASIRNSQGGIRLGTKNRSKTSITTADVIGLREGVHEACKLGFSIESDNMAVIKAMEGVRKYPGELKI